MKYVRHSNKSWRSSLLLLISVLVSAFLVAAFVHLPKDAPKPHKIDYSEPKDWK